MDKLFPIETEITQEILDSITEMGRNNAHYCIGAKTLKSVLPNTIGEDKKIHEKVFWGKTTGSIYLSTGRIKITTKEGIDMTKVSAPTKITFIIE